MNKNIIFAASAAAAMFSIAMVTSQHIDAKGKITYPQAPVDATVVDDYFGVKVADPYRPLESDTASATLKWVEQENKVTADYLSQIPFRPMLRRQIEAFNNYSKQGAPSRWKDGKYYFYRNDGLKNQSVLYRMDTLGAEPVVVLDPNALSDDGTVALTGVSMSKDGKHIAYTISRSGSDWTEIYVMDAETLTPLDDHVEWAKFTGAEWREKGIDGEKGFFYSAYPRPEAGKEFSNANEYHNIYFHKLGTPQSEDTLVFTDAEHPLHFHSVGLSDDERYMFISVGGQGFGNGLMYKDLEDPAGEWVVVEPSQEYEVGVVNIVGDSLILQTSYNAPRNRVVTAPLSAPTKENWRDLIPEADDAVLTGCALIYGDRLFVNYEKDAADHPALYKLDGSKIRDIKLPTFGSAGFSLSKEYPDAFYTFTSFLYPSTIFGYDLDTDESTLYFSPEIKGFNPDDYVTEQVFYPSSDGTMVPMFLTHRKDLKRDGTSPVYLYGYGGFNISLTPGFSPNRLVWLENGGIYAQTNLRGGAEYGEAWHEAGTKMKKINVFNDFIGAAEYLIKEGWTNPEMIAIEGGSNGGLLVGAVTNMRPDLFKVAIPRVGVMDMMRYHLFTIGWNWASDYGTSADSPEMASYLLGYSPVHTIKNDGTPYPAIMVTTADHDDRVVPAHSFKYAATLQAADTGDAPKLIRIDSKAGHGAGKPIAKVIDEYADIYSFIFYNLGIVPAGE
ncbi:MAG: prolyl oligopeptidase family serine peptidase [Muribaculaceae bacterium]|nr:prolyl oligopeptidase family serine peptidase [Muribaculaceae bacterium]